MQSEKFLTMIVVNVLQTSIDSICTEDQEPISDTITNTQSQQKTAAHWQKTAAHWLPSVADYHALA